MERVFHNSTRSQEQASKRAKAHTKANTKRFMLKNANKWNKSSKIYIFVVLEAKIRVYIESSC